MKYHVSIDFNDDIWLSQCDWTPQLLRQAMAELAARGIDGIRWIEHGRLDDGLYDPGSMFERNGKVTRVAAEMPDPRQVVIDAAHELGMEVTQVLKPNDLSFGSPCVFWPHGHGPRPPLGLPEIAGEGAACVHWLRDNPDKREQLHPSLLEQGPRKPIRAIRLWHEGADLPAAPPIDLYVSSDNKTYSRYEGPVQVSQETRLRRPPLYAPAPEKLYGEEGQFVCVELSGLNIDAPFVALKPAEPWPLTNTLTAMVEMEDVDGQIVPFTWGVTPAQPHPQGVAVDWKEGGIAYDCARKSLIPRSPLATTSALRMTLNLAQQQWIGLARGRNQYRGGYVDLANDDVRGWLLGMVKDALRAGVDAVDIRMSGHAESLDTENYGFSPSLIEKFRQRHGVDISKEPFDRAAWRELRGEVYRDFLGEVGEEARKQGKKVLSHLHSTMDVPAAQSSEQQRAWHWRKWATEGLVDMMAFKVFDPKDKFYATAIEFCKAHKMPLIWDRKPPGSDKEQGWLQSIEQAQRDGFEEFDLYEMSLFLQLQEDGTLHFRFPQLWERIARDKSTFDGK